MTARFAPLIAVVTVALACSAAAQEPQPAPADIRLGGPLMREAPEGIWAQRNVTAINRTDTELPFRIEYVTTDRDGVRKVYVTELTVPAGGERRTKLAMRYGVLPGIATEEDPVVEVPQTYAFTAGERARRELTRTVVKIFDDKTIVAWVTDGNTEPQEDVAYVEQIAGDPLGAVKMLHVLPEDLPTRWYGLDAFDIILVGGVDPTVFAGDRLVALLDWVRRGGMLVLLAGPRLPDLLAGPLGEAAGVEPTGTREVTVLRPSRPEVVSPEQIALPEPMILVELAPREATAEYRTDDLPLLTSRQLGQGFVNVITVAPQALRGEVGKGSDRWLSPLPTMWKVIFDQRLYRPALSPRKFLPPAREALDRMGGPQAPGRVVPAGVLIGLALVAGGGGTLLRLTGRGRLIWVLLPVLILAVGLLAWGSGRTGQIEARLDSVGLLTGSRDGTARVQQALAFRHRGGTDGAELTFTAGVPRATIEDLNLPAGGALGEQETRTDTVMSLPDREVAPGGTRRFYLDATVELEGVSGPLTFDANGLTGELVNQLPATVKDAVIYVNRRTIPVGTLRPDEPIALTVGEGDATRVRFRTPSLRRDLPPLPPERHRELRDALGGVEPARRAAAVQAAWAAYGRGDDPAQAVKQYAAKTGAAGALQREARVVEGEFSAGLVGSVQDVLRERTAKAMAAVPSLTIHPDPDPVLIGYMEHAILDPLEEVGTARRGWSIVSWPLELRAPEPGTKIYLPSAFVEVDPDQRGIAIWSPSDEQFLDVSREGNLVLRIRPLADDLHLGDVTAHLRIRMEGPNYELRVFDGQTYQGEIEGEPIARVRGPSGTLPTVRIDDLGRFQREDGVYLLTLRVTLPPGAPAADVLRGGLWRFEEIDVALEGVVR